MSSFLGPSLPIRIRAHLNLSPCPRVNTPLLPSSPSSLPYHILSFFCLPTVYYVPRCMGGCLLMHIGIDLTKESLWDSYHSFDVFEYLSGKSITVRSDVTLMY